MRECNFLFDFQTKGKKIRRARAKEMRWKRNESGAKCKYWKNFADKRFLCKKIS
jgi:hypothetical protein